MIKTWFGIGFGIDKKINYIRHTKDYYLVILCFKIKIAEAPVDRYW